MLKASIAKASFLIDFEKSLWFSMISYENVRKITSILLDFFLNCPRILQIFSSNLLDFEFENAVGTLVEFWPTFDIQVGITLAIFRGELQNHTF